MFEVCDHEFKCNLSAGLCDFFCKHAAAQVQIQNYLPIVEFIQDQGFARLVYWPGEKGKDTEEVIIMVGH